MSTYYFDSSAWVKVYVPETGTPWVTNIFGTKTPSGQPLHRIAVVNIGIVEVAAAIARRERMGQIRLEKRRQLYKRIWFDFVSADMNLCSAAAAEGLTADNPNNHP